MSDSIKLNVKYVIKIECGMLLRDCNVVRYSVKLKVGKKRRRPFYTQIRNARCLLRLTAQAR